MSLSDCPRCWSTPCTCGWRLRRYSLEELEEQKLQLEKAIQFKTDNPKAIFSSWGKSTLDDEKFYKFLNPSSTRPIEARQ